MKKYSNKISLAKNARGVWGLDTVKGCKYGMALNKKGCYSNCYAYIIANRYGYDFSNSTLRSFESREHLKNTVDQIKNINAKFIRIGVMGDPSECWGHTIDICDKIKTAGKKIVIVTKHWELLPSYLYQKVKSLNLIINTSISALDSLDLLTSRLREYNKLKNICTSVLRIVSCEFNTSSILGKIYNDIQEGLFENHNIIDTVLRISETHELVSDLTVKTQKIKFISSVTNASIYNKKTHLGSCKNCTDKCGIIF